jgi:biotin operon repressor
MHGRNIRHAIEAVREKGVDTDLKLYDKIEELSGENIYKLSRALGWSSGRTYTSARRLERAGMVLIDKVERNGRSVLVVRPRAWNEYLTEEELDEIRRLEIE